MGHNELHEKLRTFNIASTLLMVIGGLILELSLIEVAAPIKYGVIMFLLPGCVYWIKTSNLLTTAEEVLAYYSLPSLDIYRTMSLVLFGCPSAFIGWALICFHPVIAALIFSLVSWRCYDCLHDDLVKFCKTYGLFFLIHYSTPEEARLITIDPLAYLDIHIRRFSTH